jgi:C_GCAxxG_C_C family probable redox protein
MNCALATVDTIQNVLDIHDDDILAAATGLEGGCGGFGSTCGVITGGALSLALAVDKLNEDQNRPSIDDSIRLAGEYHRWFTDTFQTTFCAKRTGVDFHTLSGQLRYFIPGDRLARCFVHIGPAAAWLIDRIQKYSPSPPKARRASKKGHAPLSCAGSVLELVKKETGNLIPPHLARLSPVFDGGVGLSGGLCGAMAGALLAAHSRFGARIRRMSLARTTVGFIVGHYHLIRRPGASVPDPYAIGKEIVFRFRESTGSILCRDITERTFDTTDQLREYHAANQTCRDLLETSAGFALDIISRWESD